MKNHNKILFKKAVLPIDKQPFLYYLYPKI